MTPFVRWWLNVGTALIVMALTFVVVAVALGTITAMALAVGFWLGGVYDDKVRRWARTYAQEMQDSRE